MPKLLIFLLTPALALAQAQLIDPSLPVGPAAIATDRAGNIFVTGFSGADSSGLYLAKYADDGTTLLWSVSLRSGELATSVAAMVVDITGNVILAGTTSVSGLSGSGLLGSVWITSVDSFGNLIYSSTFGEDHDQLVSGLAVEMDGSAYVLGSTTSTTFPVTADAALSTYGGGPSDGFLAIVNNAGVLTYATFLGGAVPKAVGVDSKNRIAIGGWIPTPDHAQEAFLARLERPGAPLQPITSIAGASSIDALAIGSDDSIYVSGLANSADFMVTRPQFANWFNASPSYSSGGRFLQRLRSDTAQVFYSAVLGTDTSFGGVRLEVRPDGAAILQAQEDDWFPHRAPLYMGGGAFWTEVAPDGSALRYSGVLSRDLIGAPTPVALAPDGTLLATSYLMLYRVTIPAVPEISLDHVANAFNGYGAGLAAGGIYELGGDGIGPDTAIWLGFDAADPPVELGGVRVRFDDLYAQLLYVSANRIICIAPDGPAYTSIHVEFVGKRSNSVFVINGEDPGLLTASFPNAGPQAYAENPDGSVNGPDNPVAAGAPIVLYETGAGGDYLCGVYGTVPAANVALDHRFAGKIYRVTCVAPKQTGPVGVGLMKISELNPFSPVITAYGNFVTIYVK